MTSPTASAREQEREQILPREQGARVEAETAQQRFVELVNSIGGIVWEAEAVTFKSCS
jgi:hypothetical protein